MRAYVLRRRHRQGENPPSPVPHLPRSARLIPFIGPWSPLPKHAPTRSTPIAFLQPTMTTYLDDVSTTSTAET